jgi:hypothetical protein
MTRDGDDGEADVTAETMMPAAIMVEFEKNLEELERFAGRIKH